MACEHTLHCQGLSKPCSSCLKNLTCVLNNSIESEAQSYLSQSVLAQQHHLIYERMDNSIINYPFYFFSGPFTPNILLNLRNNFPTIIASLCTLMLGFRNKF